MSKKRKYRLYIDVCALCRPFDDQNSMRIRLETDAYHLIVRHIVKGVYELVASPVHSLEIRSIDDPMERNILLTFLGKYSTKILLDPAIIERIDSLYALGVGLGDAAHLAFAEFGSDIFITCDDKLLKQCVKINSKIPAMNPAQFCLNEELL